MAGRFHVAPVVQGLLHPNLPWTGGTPALLYSCTQIGEPIKRILSPSCPQVGASNQGQRKTMRAKGDESLGKLKWRGSCHLRDGKGRILKGETPEDQQTTSFQVPSYLENFLLSLSVSTIKLC